LASDVVVAYGLVATSDLVVTSGLAVTSDLVVASFDFGELY
jgi:hypothetical protein